MSKNTLTIARGVGVIGATVALMVGATFAALNSNSVTLSDNTVNTATASLKIFDPVNGFNTTTTGFTVTGLAPGQTSAPFNFYFKNDGDVGLALTASSSAITGTIDPSTVTLNFTDDSNGHVDSYTLDELQNSGRSLADVLPAGAQGDSSNPTAVGNYSVTVSLSNSVTQNNLEADPFTLTFSGTQQ